MDGGFAEELCLPALKLLPIPHGIAPEVALQSEPLAVAMRVVRRLRPEHGDPIAIAGGGCIGGYAGEVTALKTIIEP